jgi:hypothetical protein
MQDHEEEGTATVHKETTRELISREAKALIMIWPGNQPRHEKHAAQMQDWITGNTKSWATTKGTIENTEQEGHIEQTSLYCIAAPKDVLEQFTKPENTEMTGTIDKILDEPNSNYDDYFPWAEPKEQQGRETPTNTQRSARKGMMQVLTKQNETHVMSIFDQTRPAPDISQGKHAFGAYEFAIETNDGAISSTARPIRPEELLRCYGYGKEHIRKLQELDWSKVRHRVRTTIPRHATEGLLSPYSRRNKQDKTMTHLKEANQKTKIYTSTLQKKRNQPYTLRTYQESSTDG